MAIILVICCHVNWRFGGPFSPGIVEGPVAMVFAWGWIGVDLFFVLSGFLITGILFDAKGGDRYFRNFYARRVLRIMPLYYAFLFSIVVLNRLGWSIVWLSADGLLSLATYTYNFRVGLGGELIWGMHHFWSLAVEEHFYLLWPLVVAALNRRSLMRACLVIAAASFMLRLVAIASGAWPLAAFFLTPCRLDGLAAGSWLALAWRDQAEWTRLRRWALPLVWSAGGLLLAVALVQGHFIPDADPIRMPGAKVGGSLVITLGLATLAVLFSAVVVLALSAREGSMTLRLLEHRGLCAIGKYSYAIYVFHILILLLTVRLLSPATGLPPFVAKIVVAVWVLAASFAAAWLSYHLYEKHFLRLKGHFQYGNPARTHSNIPSASRPLTNA